MDERFWIRLLPWRLKGRPETIPGQIKFGCQLAFTRENGWNYLELLLVNRSSWTVWVEEASIALDDLSATLQTTVPSEHAKITIRQNVEAHETLNVSLASALYDAAGRPQGHYSCLLVADVHYSVFDEWCNVQSNTHRAMMRGLIAVGLCSLRRYNKNIKQIKISRDLGIKANK